MYENAVMRTVKQLHEQQETHIQIRIYPELASITSENGR